MTLHDDLSAALALMETCEALRPSGPGSHGSGANWLPYSQAFDRSNAANRDFIQAHATELQELARKAAFWDAFCEEAEAGTFDTVLIHDAMEMGAGVLELHFGTIDPYQAIDAALAHQPGGGENG